MTRRASKIVCLSCGAMLDTVRSFCDDACEAYVLTHGYGHYGIPKRDRGIPHRANTVRFAYRR